MKEQFTKRLFTQKEKNILDEIIKNRRDVRGYQFLNKEISQLAIDQIIEAALHAPSVGFSQPWEFIVIKNKSTKIAVKESFSKKTAEEAKLFSGEKQKQYLQLKLEGIEEAPLNIAIFYTPSEKPILGETAMPEMGKFSVACAIENMWLMARALNIGMGWVSILDPEKIKTLLNAPKNRTLIGYLCLGYTNSFYSIPELEIKQWERKKKKDEVVFKESYPL